MPEALRKALVAVFGDEVDDVRIVERSWYARMHFGARATTAPQPHPAARLGGRVFRRPELLLHEYFHVLRQWNRGRLSIAAYLAEWAASRVLAKPLRAPGTPVHAPAPAGPARAGRFRPSLGSAGRRPAGTTHA